MATATPASQEMSNSSIRLPILSAPQTAVWLPLSSFVHRIVKFPWVWNTVSCDCHICRCGQRCPSVCNKSECLILQYSLCVFPCGVTKLYYVCWDCGATWTAECLSSREIYIIPSQVCRLYFLWQETMMDDVESISCLSNLMWWLSPVFDYKEWYSDIHQKQKPHVNRSYCGWPVAYRLPTISSTP